MIRKVNIPESVQYSDVFYSYSSSWSHDLNTKSQIKAQRQSFFFLSSTRQHPWLLSLTEWMASTRMWFPPQDSFKLSQWFCCCCAWNHLFRWIVKNNWKDWEKPLAGGTILWGGSESREIERERVFGRRNGDGSGPVTRLWRTNCKSHANLDGFNWKNN